MGVDGKKMKASFVTDILYKNYRIIIKYYKDGQPENPLLLIDDTDTGETLFAGTVTNDAQKERIKKIIKEYTGMVYNE